MKNYEKYIDKVLEAASEGGISVTADGAIRACCDIQCDCCIFDGRHSCSEKTLEWLKAEYEEEKVDWTKVKVDTKILVRDSEEAPWKPRHFACFKDGNVFSYAIGTTYFTADNDITPWKYAKLY